jgi:uncharacterized protein
LKHRVPDELLGRTSFLTVRRIVEGGALIGRITDEERDCVFLPTVSRERKRAGTLKEGEDLEVFIYLTDNEPQATLQRPLVERDEVAFLTATHLTTFGAFFDWGLPKELLVPRDEQIRDVRVGDRHAVGIYLDDTGRLAGTMRVSELLAAGGEHRVGDWVQGEAWRKEPGIGVFVIVEKRYVGLLPESEPHDLSRGEAARFRVAHVHRDGKIELSLRALAHEQRGDDAKKILAVLASKNVRVGDHSSPEEIRALFGLSKKAFKRAVGGLLKERAVAIDEEGIVRVV